MSEWDIGLLIIAYMLGSIPFGLIFSKMAGLGDIRTIGSGNIGATNALRTGNKKVALATLLADMGKGALAVAIVHVSIVYVSKVYVSNAGVIEFLPYLAGIVAMIGHVFPVWLRFKGGKGVATFLGLLLMASWLIGVIACAVWVVIFAVWRYSSLASLSSALVVMLLSFVMLPVIPACILNSAALLLIARHKENILRLIRGQEKAFRK